MICHAVDVAVEKARGHQSQGLSSPMGQGQDGSVVEVDVVGGL